MLIACIFPRPCGARKNTKQLEKYPHVLYAKPSNKVYLLNVLYFFLWSLNFEPLDLARIFIVFVGHGVRDFFNREKREIKNRENKYQ